MKRKEPVHPSLVLNDEKYQLLNEIADNLVDLTELSDAAGEEFLTYLISIARIEAATLAKKASSAKTSDIETVKNNQEPNRSNQRVQTGMHI